MAYHRMILDTNFPEEKAVFEGATLPRGGWACFSGFLHTYAAKVNDDHSVYVAMLLNKKVEKLILDFNRLFTNIKAEIKFKRPLMEYDNWESIQRNYCELETRAGLKNIGVYVLSINFTKEYTNNSRLHMYQALFQFFRQYAPFSSYGSHYRMAQKCGPTVKGLLKGHAEYGARTAYGCWNSLATNLEEFLTLDKPKLMNIVVKDKGHWAYYGTELFTDMRAHHNNKPVVKKAPKADGPEIGDQNEDGLYWDGDNWVNEDDYFDEELFEEDNDE